MIQIKSALAMLLWGGRHNRFSTALEPMKSYPKDVSEEKSGVVSVENSMQSNYEEERIDEDLSPTNLKLIIIISGKRKSGKDHISTLITNYVGYSHLKHLAVLRISGPIKRQFARSNKLDFERLLDVTSYKEQYRLLMVEWSENYREKVGWHCFLRTAIMEQGAKHKSIWLVTDARRTCDFDYFEDDQTFENVQIIKIRIQASEESRISRGWVFDDRIDMQPTECGLDDYKDWTCIIDNDDDDDRKLLQESLRPIYEAVDRVIEEIDRERSENELEYE